MKHCKIIYHRETYTGKTEVCIKDGMVYFIESSFFSQVHLQLPLENLDRAISFSRVHHVIFLAVSFGYLIMSIPLLWKSRHIDGWIFYFALSIVSFILLGYIYYFAYGKQFGTVELKFGDNTKYLKMTEKEYWVLKEVLNHLNP